MTVKDFCAKCANWYTVEITSNSGEILFHGTTLDAYYSKYANKQVGEINLDYEGLVLITLE